MADSHSVYTPGVGKELLNDGPGAKELGEREVKEYQAMVGGLIYITQCTRWDIAYRVPQLVRGMIKPTDQHHMIAVKRVMRYLKGTPDLHIT